MKIAISLILLVAALGISIVIYNNSGLRGRPLPESFQHVKPAEARLPILPRTNSSVVSAGASAGSARSSLLHRLEGVDCAAFYARSVTNQVPELRLLDHLLARFALPDAEKYMAIRRAYEGVSDNTRFTEHRDEAIERAREDTQRYVANAADSAAARKIMDEMSALIRGIRDSFDGTIRDIRSETLADLRILIPNLDDETAEILFLVRPKVPATPEDFRDRHLSGHPSQE